MAVIDRIRTTPPLGNLFFQTSVEDGLVGLYQPRKSDRDVVVNRAPDGVAASLYGAPSYTLWGAVLGPEAYLDTVHPETPQFTILTVARKASVAGGLALVSTLIGSASTTPGVTVGYRNGDGQAARFQTDVKTTPDTAAQALGYDFPVGDTGFEFFASICTAIDQTNLMPRNPAGVVGGNPRTVALAGSRDAGSETWRIGAIKVASALYPGSTEIALVMIYNRALTGLEARAVYAEARAYFGPRGIAI